MFDQPCMCRGRSVLVKPQNVTRDMLGRGWLLFMLLLLAKDGSLPGLP